jgi:hypothetical protein
MSLEPCCGGQKAALLRSATLDDIDDDVDDKRVASTADDGRRQKRQRLELVWSVDVVENTFRYSWLRANLSDCVRVQPQVANSDNYDVDNNE